MNWFTRLFSPHKALKKPKKAPRVRLGVECLEAREVPASVHGGGSGPTVTLVNPGTQTNQAGTVIGLVETASDSDSYPLTFSATGLPAWLSISSSSGEITGTVPDNSATGSSPFSVTVEALDASSGVSASQTFNWNITPPTVTLANPGNQTGSTGSSPGWSLSGWDSDSYALTYYASGLPDGLSVDPSSGQVQGSIAADADLGTPNSVTITAEDASSGVGASQTFNWTITPAPIARVISMDAQIQAGHEVLLTGVVSENDPAGVTVTFSGAVSGSTTTDLNGDFSYLTTQAALGTVYATGVDQQGQSTNTTSAVLSVPAPSLALSATVSASDTVILTGQLTGIDPAGATISIGGLTSDSVITDVNGDFSYMFDPSSSGTLEVTSTDLWGQSANTVAVNVTSGSGGVTASITPQITLSAQVLPGHEVVLSGTVLDDQPGGATVTFSGAVSGTATTAADGTFSFTTTDASLGTVSAVAVDTNLQTTNVASAQIAVAAPLLTMYVTSISATSATVSGQLADLDQADETVQFSGVASGSTTTDANGHFSFTASTASIGNLTAVATDAWGQTSNTDTTELPQRAFAILDFSASQEAFGWEFQGRVIGFANQNTVSVTFGGLQAISGTTVSVSADGEFVLLRALANGVFGTATAVAADSSNNTSTEPVGTYVCGNLTTSFAPGILNRGTPLDVAGQNVAVNFNADNLPGDSLTFTAFNLPDGLNIDPTTGVVSGIVAADAVSATPYDVTIDVQDDSGNENSSSFQWVINSAVPAVTGVSTTASSGSYAAGDTIAIEVTFSESVLVAGVPQLALNSGGTAIYSSGSGTNTLTFLYTVASGDASADLDYASTAALSLNGGSITDGSGNDADLTLAATGASSLFGSDIVITG